MKHPVEADRPHGFPSDRRAFLKRSTRAAVVGALFSGTALSAPAPAESPAGPPLRPLGRTRVPRLAFGGAGLLGAWSRYVAPWVAPEQHCRLPGAAIRWTLQDERVDLLCIGMRLPSDIDANLRTLRGNTRLTRQTARCWSPSACGPMKAMP